MTITRVTAASTLAAFAFLSVAAISAISMLSPMQEATAQEPIATCVILYGGKNGPNQLTGPPQILLIKPGDEPIGEILPPAACAHGAN